MSELKPLVCERCGGIIDRKTMRCPYCGTEYAYNDNRIQVRFIERQKPGEQVICVQATVDSRILVCDPEGATECALEEMRQQMADSLLAFMKISTCDNPAMNAKIIRGVVRVIDPENIN